MLVFKHLMLNYEELTDVDGTILVLWKLMKYSIFIAAIVQETQEAQDLKSRKLFKTAAFGWLSHDRGSASLVSLFQDI